MEQISSTTSEATILVVCKKPRQQLFFQNIMVPTPRGLDFYSDELPIEAKHKQKKGKNSSLKSIPTKKILSEYGPIQTGLLVIQKHAMCAFKIYMSLHHATCPKTRRPLSIGIFSATRLLQKKYSIWKTKKI